MAEGWAVARAIYVLPFFHGVGVRLHQLQNPGMRQMAEHHSHSSCLTGRRLIDSCYSLYVFNVLRIKAIVSGLQMVLWRMTVKQCNKEEQNFLRQPGPNISTRMSWNKMVPVACKSLQMLYGLLQPSLVVLCSAIRRSSTLISETMLLNALGKHSLLFTQKILHVTVLFSKASPFFQFCFISAHCIHLFHLILENILWSAIFFLGGKNSLKSTRNICSWVNKELLFFSLWPKLQHTGRSKRQLPPPYLAIY